MTTPEHALQAIEHVTRHEQHQWAVSFDVALGHRWRHDEHEPAPTPEQTEDARLTCCALIACGLLDGCTCGCRGDFTLTPHADPWLALIHAGGTIPRTSLRIPRGAARWRG